MNGFHVTDKSFGWDAIYCFLGNKQFVYDEVSSKRAGYDIWRRGNDYVCDLNDRLELNLDDGRSINIWISNPELKSAQNALKELGKNCDELKSENENLLCELKAAHVTNRVLEEEIIKLKAKLYDYIVAGGKN